MTRRRLEKATSGRLTANGRKEQKRRHTQNPLLLRNKNLAPASHKRLESNMLRQIDDEGKVFNDNYKFLVGLINKNQDIIGRIPGIPLISIKKVMTNPQK